ncbi:protein TESPA1 isoform X2 [Pieris rapae]|uniref:protein TESPA1 isoform X2 n=1 Tax=Pieris rapae TaxID=64459 RepID=UPI001E27B556|nr:protein TESPA1 isoform X2 [Pieris rapae]
MDTKQDTFNETVSSLLERKVRGWLSGVIEDMRRSSPVQQWLDSLPSEDANLQEATLNCKKDEDDSDTAENKAEESITDNTVIETQNDLQEDKSLEVPDQKELLKRKSLESGVLNDQLKNKSKLQRDHSIQSEGYTPRLKNPLLRDHSLQSDGSGSSGSSVLNVLGARKVDAESVLLALGFGPSEKQQKLQRIPDRFLVPSKLKGISTEEFIKNEQHSMKMHDCGVFGYRGLTEHCTPVCRFMKPVPSNYGPYQVPQIAVQKSSCSTVDNCS